MSTYAYNEILNQVERLTPDEQRQLIKDIEAMLHRQAKPKHRHSIMELKGLGKEIWKDIDVAEYIREERASWNG
jgi:RecJ-like exonuclease